jgi:hypothetical protein
MSFTRFVYYSAVTGGWAAFFAWLLLERLIVHLRTLGETAAQMRAWNVVSATVTATVVGAAIAVGLNLVAGMTNAQWKRQLRNAVPGLIGGGLGGTIGGLLGGLLHTYLKFPQFLGWTIMGLAIGSAQGMYEGSSRKTRNGLIGGVLGGLLGGLLFGLIARPGAQISGRTFDMSSRAVGFVVLGLSVGAMIGLAQVVLKEAWLTVVDGFRPGRRLILAQAATFLGRGDHLALPFLGYSGRDLESEHLKITRRPDGRYVIEDNGSRAGTRVNGQFIHGAVVLDDDDLIKLGTNIVRFNQRDRRGHAADASANDWQPGAADQIPPPPPPPGQSGAGMPPAPTATARPPLPAQTPRHSGASLTPPPRPLQSPGPGLRIPPPPPPPV